DHAFITAGLAGENTLRQEIGRPAAPGRGHRVWRAPAPGTVGAMDLPLSPLDRFAALGGVPAAPAADRDARETAYNLLSAAIGLHSALLHRASAAERDALEKEARRLLDREARLPFLDGAELRAVAEEFPELLRSLRGRHWFGPAPAAPKPLGGEEL